MFLIVAAVAAYTVDPRGKSGGDTDSIAAVLQQA